MAASSQQLAQEATIDPKIKRRPAVKSRNGCAVCKRRHVKCDETRPSCLRCRVSGWTCPGYPDLDVISSGHRRRPRAIAPSTPGQPQPARLPIESISARPNHRPATSGQILPALKDSLGLSLTERRYFKFFLSKTASDLVNFSGSSFWQSVVLQMAHHESSIRHAIMAVAAYHESGLKDEQGGQSHNEHFSLSQYNSSIRALSSRLSDDRLSYQIIMINCLLYVHLEFLKGAPVVAFTHLSNGLRLLPFYRDHARSVDAPTYLTRSQEQIIDEELNRTFSRFFRFRMTTLSEDIDARDVYKLAVLEIDPIDRSSSEVTASSNDNAVNTLANLQCAATSLKFFLTPKHDEGPAAEATQRSKPISYPEIDVGQGEDTSLITWLSSAKRLLNEHTGVVDMRSRHLVLSLHVTSLMARIWNSAQRSQTQNNYDPSLQQFTEIISIISEVAVDNPTWNTVAIEHAPSDMYNATNGYCPLSRIFDHPLSDGSVSCSPDMPDDVQFKLRFVFPLWFVAIKCRSPSIRRQAIALMPTQQSISNLQNIEIFKNVAQYVIHYEEAQCNHVITDDVETWPTEQQRIQTIYFLPIYGSEGRTQTVMFASSSSVPASETRYWTKKFSLRQDDTI